MCVWEGGVEWRGVEWSGGGEEACVWEGRGEKCVCVGGESGGEGERKHVCGKGEGRSVCGGEGRVGLGIEGGRQCDGKHISACGAIYGA